MKTASQSSAINKSSDKELFEEFYKTKDPAIREELIKRNYYIAKILSKKYLNRGIDYDDILQVASLGLIYAIDRYDPTKGFQFSSFATPTIIGEIKKYFRDKGWQIRVPRRIQELSGKINAAKDHLSRTLGKIPKVPDIADYLGVTQEDVLEAMDASMAYAPISLDLRFDSSSEDSATLGELIGDDDDKYADYDNKDFLNKITRHLSDKEKIVVNQRFFENKTQTEVAKMLGVSQMSISRMEKKILEKLRKEYAGQL